ncbi:MAG TPA: DUF4397 domain-containing protein [Micromonospora sp.]
MSQLGRSLAVGALLCAVVTAGQVAPPATAAASAPQVYLVQGIPGQTLDLYVDGNLVLTGVRPGGVAGPIGLDLTRGTHDIVLTPERAPLGSAIVTELGMRVPAEPSLSLVTHLTGAGGSAVTAYVNDLTRTGAGKARLVVRHAADAPAAEVQADQTTLFTELAGSDEQVVDVDAGRTPIQVRVATPGGGSVLSPGRLPLTEGTSTIVHLVGSARDRSLSLVVQTIDGLGTTPRRSGLSALSSRSLSLSWYALGFAGMILFVGGFGLLRLRLSTR